MPGQTRRPKGLDNETSGVVITCPEMDALRNPLIRIEEAWDYAEAVVAATRHPMLLLDGNPRVMMESDAFHRSFLTNEKETIGNLLHRLGNGQWGYPRTASQSGHVLANDKPSEDSW